MRSFPVLVYLAAYPMVLLAQVPASTAPATAPAEGAAAAPAFEQVLDRVRQAASNRDWEKHGWSDAVLHQWLEDLVEHVDRATDGSVPAGLPVTFEHVEPIREADAAELPRLEGALLVTRGIKLVSADRSILIVDGNVRVSHCNGCVIVARGAVDISHGRGNIVIAGHFIHVSHDGRSTPARPIRRDADGGIAMELTEPGSLLVSGSTVDVAHAHGSIVVAPDLARISHANACTFINSPTLEVPNNHGGVAILDEKFPNVRPSVHPLGKSITVRWVVPSKGAVFDLRQKRYVAEVGKPITDESGAAVAELEGWTVSFADDGYVLFTDGRKDVGFAASDR